MDKANSIEARVIESMLRIFGDKYRGAITGETTMEDLDAWDSLSFIDLLLDLEEEFATRFSMNDSAEMISVPAICAIVEKQRGAAE